MKSWCLYYLDGEVTKWVVYFQTDDMATAGALPIRIQFDWEPQANDLVNKLATSGFTCLVPTNLAERTAAIQTPA